MQRDGEIFIAAMNARAASMATACTSCVDCVTACPMLEGGETEALIGGVLDLLGSGGEAGPEAWPDACTCSGTCIPRKLEPALHADGGQGHGPAPPERDRSRKFQLRKVLWHKPER